MFEAAVDGSGGNQIKLQNDEIEEAHKYDQTNETRNFYFCNRSENMPICCRWCYMRAREWGENIICIPNEFHCATNRVRTNQLKLGDIDDKTMNNVWSRGKERANKWNYCRQQLILKNCCDLKHSENPTRYKCSLIAHPLVNEAAIIIEWTVFMKIETFGELSWCQEIFKER